MNKETNSSTETAAITMPATVEKVIKSPFPDEPDKAQIAVHGADELYRELRIENSLQNENGEAVELKQGAKIDVTIEAPAEAVVPKEEH
jgi:hypothetical protein